MPEYMPIVIDPRDLCNVYIKDADDNHAINVDGSVTPVPFSFTPGPHKQFLLLSFDVIVVDRSIDAGDFGGIVGGLTNGLTLNVQADATKQVCDLGAGIKIKKNWDWSHLCGMDWNIDRTDKMNVLTARLALSGNFFATVLKADHAICMTVFDDLTSLDRFEATVHGVYLDT